MVLFLFKYTVFTPGEPSYYHEEWRKSERRDIKKNRNKSETWLKILNSGSPSNNDETKSTQFIYILKRQICWLFIIYLYMVIYLFI